MKWGLDMRVEIDKEYGKVMLSGQLLPGEYQGMDVSGAVRINEEEAPGRSGKLKQATGYEDCTVTLSLLLKNDDQSSPYEKLKELVRFFRKTDKTAKPEVYTIVSHLTDAWGLDDVVFKDLKTSDPRDGDVIRASLEFVEWQSPLVAIEAKAVQGPIVDRTATIPSVSGNTDVEEWKKRPTDSGTYQDTIEVPDDD